MKQVKISKKLARLLVSSSLSVIAGVSEAALVEVHDSEDVSLEIFSLNDDFGDVRNCGCGSGGICNSGCNGSC